MNQFRPMKIAPHSLIFHWNEVFLNFLSFPSFRIGSIAQNENPEMLELFNFLKVCWIAKFWSTRNILGVSSVSIKIFKISIYGFILVALYRISCYTCCFHISVKFPGKYFQVIIFLTFTAVQNILRDQRSKGYEKNGTKSFTL